MATPKWAVVADTSTTAPLKGQATPWALRLYALVQQRGRITHAELLTRVMPVVPPGVALRRYEQHRAAHLKSRGQGPTRAPMSVDAQIEYGQRTKVHDTLWSLTKRERVFQETDEHGVRWVVFNPDWSPFGDRDPDGVHQRAVRSAASRKRNRELSAAS